MQNEAFEELKREILHYDGRHPWSTTSQELEVLKRSVITIIEYLEKREQDVKEQ